MIGLGETVPSNFLEGDLCDCLGFWANRLSLFNTALWLINVNKQLHRVYSNYIWVITHFTGQPKVHRFVREVG